METGERGSIDSFKAALEWCLKEKNKTYAYDVLEQQII